MSRVKQSIIEKARCAINDYRTRPSSPSGEDLLNSNTALHNTVVILNSMMRGEIPMRTLCGLLLEDMGLAQDTTADALWKRYSREQARRERRKSQESETLTPQSNDDIHKADDSGEKADTINSSKADDFWKKADTINPQVFIDPGIHQPELAESLAEFFEDQGHSRVALLITCFIAIDKMGGDQDLSHLKKMIDEWSAKMSL